MPPELFVLVVRRGVFWDPFDLDGLSGATMKGSLCSLPRTSHPPKPDPISNPLVAGMESIACASLASSLSKQGSPRPTGTLRITQVTVPPIESLRSRIWAMRSDILDAVGSSGQRTGRKESTVSRVMVERRERKSGFVEGVGWAAVGG